MPPPPYFNPHPPIVHCAHYICNVNDTILWDGPSRHMNSYLWKQNMFFIFQLKLMLVLIFFVQLKIFYLGYAACMTYGMLKMVKFHFSSGILKFHFGPEKQQIFWIRLHGNEYEHELGHGHGLGHCQGHWHGQEHGHWSTVTDISKNTETDTDTIADTRTVRPRHGHGHGHWNENGQEH